MIVATSVITLGFGVLSAILVLAGGIVLFTAGRGRGGALPGAGFVVLAVGTVTGSLLSAFAPVLIRDENMTPGAFSAMFTIVLLLFDLVGWGLIIAAIITLARPEPATAGPPPGTRPGPWHGQAPPGYGPYPTPPGPGYGGPPSGPGGPPPPPGY